MKKILITDSLFIFPKHEKQLCDAGFEICRLNKPDASEDELVEIIKDKSGYILGGIELVTKKVITAAEKLEAIVLCGTSYKGIIPAWQYAMKKGIAIANVPDGHTQAVAEWSLTVALTMNRGIFDLLRTGKQIFGTTTGIHNQTVGIIGLGRIGRRIAEMIQTLRPQKILYYSMHRHESVEKNFKLINAKMNTLLQKSDIIFLCVPPDVGKDFFSYPQFQQVKHGSLLISCIEQGIINPDALFSTLQSGKIRAASDYPMDERFNIFPLSVWYSFNAFNTHQGLLYTSDEATKSLKNLLTKGDDKNLINPRYK